MGRFARDFSDFYRATSGDIFKFSKAMNFEPTNQQGELFKLVQAGERRIACKSGQGPGKTTGSAIIGLWRAWRNYNALTIVTAPTMRQCKDVWLVEARRRIEKADPMIQKFIEVTKSKVEIAGMPDWGCKLVTATREENAQGFHQEKMSVIAEEASGIPRELVTQFKGTLSNPDSLFLMIGNPNTRDCSFFDCFNRERSRWECLTFNAEDTARDYPWLVDPQRNLDLADEFGRDSDVYRVRVLGEFPHSDPNCVISSEDLEHVMNPDLYLEMVRRLRPAEYGGGHAKQFGIDVARYGGDENVIMRRSGYAIVEWKKMVHTDPNTAVDNAFRMQVEADWTDENCSYVVDATGMGQGVMQNFYRAGKRLHEFHNHGSAYRSDLYANKITEAWFYFARLVKERACYIPRDNQLIEQLCSRQYYTNKKGQLTIESKDEYLKRDHEHSPDRAEACVLAFYDMAWTRARTASR